MTNRTVTLQIPEAIYERIEQNAQATGQTVEMVATDFLTWLWMDLPPDLTPEALETFFDYRLRAIAWHPHFSKADTMLRRLHKLNEQGELPDEQRKEFDALRSKAQYELDLSLQSWRILERRGLSSEHRAELRFDR
ncbi:MAG: hypothetical protein F9K46_06520 [Anaerolineae bacterium]|nr:MAG: hypothetical protein F9K46_06520 [Anaerolineae bacterium]